MVDVAQSVRVTDCGSEGRGFESHLPPEQQSKEMSRIRHLFVFVALRYANLFVERRDIKTKEVVEQLLAREFGSAPAASGRERRAERRQSHLPPLKTL